MRCIATGVRDEELIALLPARPAAAATAAATAAASARLVAVSARAIAVITPRFVPRVTTARVSGIVTRVSSTARLVSPGITRVTAARAASVVTAAAVDLLDIDQLRPVRQVQGVVAAAGLQHRRRPAARLARVRPPLPADLPAWRGVEQGCPRARANARLARSGAGRRLRRRPDLTAVDGGVHRGALARAARRVRDALSAGR